MDAGLQLMADMNASLTQLLDAESADIQGGADSSAANPVPLAGPLNVTLSTGNVFINRSPFYYVSPWSVLVTDMLGTPVPGAEIRLSVTAVPFGDPDGNRAYIKGSLVAGDTFWQYGGFQTCANEDINQNGLLDEGEDFNGDGELTPGSFSVVLGSEMTNRFGMGRIYFAYPKSHAWWATVKLMAEVIVDGVSYADFENFILLAHPDDVQVDPDGSVPPNLNSPFGVELNCSSPF